MNIRRLTLEQLEQKRKDIEDRLEHWESCQDGSYGMALSYAGYYDVNDEIQRRIGL